MNPDPWIVHGQTVTALAGQRAERHGRMSRHGNDLRPGPFQPFRPAARTSRALHEGPTVDQCWVGLNDAMLIAEVELVPPVEPPVEVIDALKPSAGLYVTKCDGDGNFTFTGIPPGEYQIVTWDTPLDALFGYPQRHGDRVTRTRRPSTATRSTSAPAVVPLVRDPRRDGISRCQRVTAFRIPAKPASANRWSTCDSATAASTRRPPPIR